MHRRRDDSIIIARAVVPADIRYARARYGSIHEWPRYLLAFNIHPVYLMPIEGTPSEWH